MCIPEQLKKVIKVRCCHLLTFGMFLSIKVCVFITSVVSTYSDSIPQHKNHTREQYKVLLIVKCPIYSQITTLSVELNNEMKLWNGRIKYPPMMYPFPFTCV